MHSGYLLAQSLLYPLAGPDPEPDPVDLMPAVDDQIRFTMVVRGTATGRYSDVAVRRRAFVASPILWARLSQLRMSDRGTLLGAR
jgi:hypothetical protein